MGARTITGDEAAVRILLGNGTDRQKQARLAKVAKAFDDIANATVACPECGNEGPHDSQRYDGEIEFCCDNCGTQFTAPEVIL